MTLEILTYMAVLGLLLAANVANTGAMIVSGTELVWDKGKIWNDA